MPMPSAVPIGYDEEGETTPDGLIEIGLVEDPTRIHYTAQSQGRPVVCPTCGYKHVFNADRETVNTFGLVRRGGSIDVRRHLRQSAQGKVSVVRDHQRRRA